MLAEDEATSLFCIFWTLGNMCQRKDCKLLDVSLANGLMKKNSNKFAAL